MWVHVLHVVACMLGWALLCMLVCRHEMADVSVHVADCSLHGCLLVHAWHVLVSLHACVLGMSMHTWVHGHA